MSVNGSYVVTENDGDEIRRRIDISVLRHIDVSELRRRRNDVAEEHIYGYEEAIDLTGLTIELGTHLDLTSFVVEVNYQIIGNGFYNIMLLITLSIGSLAMGVDIFGFSVVVNGATCEFGLNLKQTGLLLSVTFIGPIVMAYPWGYISDTKGRRMSLIISLWASFLFSCLSAFSPDWITMAVLKLISTSFSSCAQSTTYTLIGECCPQRVRDAYMLIMASILDLSLAVYVGLAYVVLESEFSYDMGFITFSPWRLLAIVLALPLGISALGIIFFHESPKFLLNEEREDEALAALAAIWKTNGGKAPYPVKRLALQEDGNERPASMKLWRSLWDHLVPLFKPPLLWRSLQLYFLTMVVYGINNSYYIWFPYLAKKFMEGIDTSASLESGLCTAIVTSYENSTMSDVQCTTKTDINLFWASLAQGLTFVVMLICIARIAHRKRLLIIAILGASGISGLAAVFVREKFTSFLLFFGMLLNELVIGVIYSYFVELYPTSFRGTASCIGTMVSRASAIGGVTLLGHYIMSHCVHTFYVSSALTICGVLVAFLLPRDKPRKTA